MRSFQIPPRNKACCQDAVKVAHIGVVRKYRHPLIAHRLQLCSVPRRFQPVILCVSRNCTDSKHRCKSFQPSFQLFPHLWFAEQAANWNLCFSLSPILHTTQNACNVNLRVTGQRSGGTASSATLATRSQLNQAPESISMPYASSPMAYGLEKVRFLFPEWRSNRVTYLATLIC